MRFPLKIFTILLLIVGCRAADFRFALAGDSIITRRISVYDEPAYLQMIGRIRSSDAAFTNFEMLIHTFEFPGAPASGGTYMGAPAWVLDELKWAGFRLFGAANNHAFDFGTDGFLSTLQAMQKAGVVYAGSGINLARARAPGYLDTGKGRVALIGCASTFSTLSPAGEQRVDLKGRPGINPLRFNTTYTVESATLASLRLLAGRNNGDPSRPLSFLGATFRSGEKPAVETAADPKDLAAIVAEIRDARRQADWVVVSIHAHEGAPHDREIPAEFLVQFAHAAIDSGADLFVGHGPHLLRGIEIYKGKPILYSMANFIFQNDLIQFQPQENYEEYNLPLDATPADFFDARSAHDTRSYPAEPKFWESVEAEVVFNEKRELKEIDLYPITLGFKRSRTVRGRPLPADAALSQSLIEHLTKLSAPMGTKIAFDAERGIGRVVR